MDGRTLWRWTKADVERARRFKAMQKPGPKSKKKKTWETDIGGERWLMQLCQNETLAIH